MKDLRSFRDSNQKCYIKHERIYTKNGSKILLTKEEAERLGVKNTLLARGGATFCRIYDEQRNLLGQGSAFCCPRDQFSKSIGRQIAIGRALKEIKERQ